MGNERSASDLIPGTLDMLILKAVSRESAMHGYAIAEFIQRTSRDVLQVEEGAFTQRSIASRFVVS